MCYRPFIGWSVDPMIYTLPYSLELVSASKVKTKLGPWIRPSSYLEDIVEVLHHPADHRVGVALLSQTFQTATTPTCM